MEFPFDINQNFPTEIVVVNSCEKVLVLKTIDLRVDEMSRVAEYVCKETSGSTNSATVKLMQDRLSMCIDVMGQKSAEAQDLKKPITSAAKLIKSDHRLYMIKDSFANHDEEIISKHMKKKRHRKDIIYKEGRAFQNVKCFRDVKLKNHWGLQYRSMDGEFERCLRDFSPVDNSPKVVSSGRGALIGILKVGKKKLFLSNRDANQVEVTPLCLLDFYIHESRQRQGCGLYLFKVMLEIEGITPLHLAIDRPSRKLLNFLEKHYGLDQPEFHPNRYVVFPGFLQCVRGDTMERGIDKQIKQSGDKDEHTSQLVAVNQSERMPNVPSPSSACGAPHSLPTSPDATKSCQISGFTPGRYDNDKRWQQMYDSWNVIGVPPRDYSYLKSGRYPPSRSGAGKNDMP